MSRLLVLAPPDTPPPRRARQLLRTLQAAGHETHCAHSDMEARQALGDYQAQALLALGLQAAEDALRLDSPLPCWADLEPDPLPPALIRAASESDDRPVLDTLQQENFVLRRADALSVAAPERAQALTGRLAALGRLNQFTFHQPLTHWLPPAPEPPFETLARDKDAPIALLYDGPHDARLDADLLFHLVEDLMQARPGLRLLACGPAGDPPPPWQSFLRHVQASPFREHYEIHPDPDHTQRPTLYARATLALHVEAPNHAARLDLPPRLTDALAAGLPLACAAHSQPALALEPWPEARLALPPTQTAAPWARTILELLDAPPTLQTAAHAARQAARECFATDRAAAPLLAWLQAPRPAPDRQPDQAPPARKGDDNPLERLAEWREQGGDPCALHRDWVDWLATRHRPWFPLIDRLQHPFG